MRLEVNTEGALFAKHHKAYKKKKEREERPRGKFFCSCFE
jgi:hypothetical protein